MPDFIVAPQRPLDGLLLDILRRVDGVARAQKVGYFLGGAMARDVILQHVFGVDTGRATRDVDLGIFIGGFYMSISDVLVLKTGIIDASLMYY